MFLKWIEYRTDYICELKFFSIEKIQSFGARKKFSDFFLNSNFCDFTEDYTFSFSKQFEKKILLMLS